MSVLTMLIPALKAVGAGLLKIGAFIAKMPATVGKVVSTGAIKLGAGVATAKTAGAVSELATAYVISKAVDKVTDATLEKVESMKPIGFAIDIITDVNLIKGVWK